jgi:hypothetical protein
MATPVLQTQGSLASTSANENLTVTIPTGEAVDDILVATLVAWVPSTSTGAATMAAPSGWTKFSPDITTITGGLIDAEYAFFWKRATSTNEANPTFTRPANWAISNWSGRIYIIRGCIKTGNPWTDLVASSISTAANPPIPSVNVFNTNDEINLPIAFMVKTDNTATPTGSELGTYNWTGQTEVTTTTGTDAAMRAYTVGFYSGTSAVSAPAMTGGTAPAQGGSVYFVASFRQPNNRTASGSGTGSGSASGSIVAAASLVSRTATGSGAGTQSATGVKTKLRTATGSGTGTQTAFGLIPKVGINWATWGVDVLIS